MLGGVGADFMLGDSGADTMRGGAGDDRLLGGGQNDALYGDAGNDDIQGGEQNDWLEGGEGNDALDGGEGNDHLRGDGDGDILNGGDGVDALEGGDGEDMLTGGKGDDLLIGGKDRDTYLLVKGDGADIVLDEDGDGVLLVDNKALDGGAQIEEMPNVWLSADRETRYVWEPDNKGIGALMIFRKGNHVVIPNFQNGKFGIKLQGSTSLYLNKLDGSAVVNEWPLVNSTGVQAEFGNKSNVILSPFGDDEIVTGEGADHFTLGLGLDLVNAGEGSDVFNLYFDHDNSGKHDTVQFSNGYDEEKNKLVGWKWELHKDNVYAHPDGYMTFFARISQDEGGLLELAYHTPTFSELWNKRLDDARKQSSEVMDSQILHGGGGDDLVQGDFGNDALFGDNGNDLLNGSLGNDFLSGGVGSDSLIGGNGRDVLLGGVGGDTLWGEWGEDSLRGGKDNDRLYGDAEYQTQEARFYGNDVLDGEEGDDTLVGGGGDDTLNGGDNADLMFGDFGTMAPSEFEGNDSLVGGKGKDTLQGAGGNDTLLGGEDNDTLYGGVGNDSMDGGEGQDALDGEADDDTLRGGDENDTLLGGDGADILVGGDGIDSLVGGNHNDVLMGDDGADILRGGEGDDKLQGGAGADKLYGDGGNDELYGGEGDQLYGGTGTDIYYVTKGQSAGVSDADSDSILIIQSAGSPAASTARAMRQARNADAGAAIGLGWVDMPQPGEPDVYLQVGDTQVYFHSNGTRFSSIMLDDKVLISGEELAAFYKREIDDVLLLRGDAGDNVLVGDHRYNRLLGLGGNDTLQAGAGDDVLIGGSGDDLLQGEEGYDLLRGDAGNDTLEASNGDDLLLGGDGDDELKGGDGADTLRGDAGADTLLGGTGDDLLQGGDSDLLAGGQGVDTYEIEQGSTVKLLDGDGGSVVVITGAAPLAAGETVPVLVKRAEEVVEGEPDIYLEVAGTRIYLESDAPLLAGIMLGDRVIMEGEALRDLLFTEISKIVMPVGDAGANTLFGTSGNNLLDAVAGNDTLHGYGGDDVLKGGDGDDLLIGGVGNDILSGGDGNDIYRIGQGEGNDQLIDGDGRNRVIFGEGISADSVSFRFDERRYSIVMDYTGGSLALGAEVKGMLEFAFADGTLKTFDELADSFLTQLRTRRGTEQADWLVGTADKNLIEGLAGDDGLYSLEGDDTLAGGQGRDTMDGGEGRDTYRFGLGDGVDTVADADGNLQIELDASVDKATVRLERVSNKGSFDLLLKYGSDDVVVVRNGLLASQLTVRFADGSAWSLADIEATLGTQVNHQVNPFGNGVDYWTGTAAGEVIAADAGRDELYGRGGNDTLDGGSGNDLLAGEQGNDTYLVYSGMGRDQVIDSGVNTLKLDASLSGADVQFALRGDDLVVQLRQSTDSVVLRDFVKQKGAGWQIQFGEQDPAEMKAWVLAALVQQDKDDKISGNSQRLRQDFLARLLGEQEELATEGELDVQHDVNVRIQRVDVTGETAEVSSTHERTEQTETTTVITPTRTDHILEQGREEIKVLRFIKHSDMSGPIDPNRYRPATRTEQVLVHPGYRHGLVDGPGQGQDGDGIDGLAPVYITQVVEGYEEITRITIPAKISTTVENITEEKTRVISTETKVGIMDVYGSAGDQSIFGSLGAISGGDGNDTLGGGWAWKTFVENHSKDMGLFLDGEAGNDVLVGTDGEDLLVASTGNDTLAGGGGGDTYSVQASSNYSLILDAGITPSFDYYNDLMKAGGGFGFGFYAGWADAIESGGSYSSRSLSGHEVASLYMGAVLTELMNGMVFTTYHPDDTEAEATYRTEEYSLITLSVRMLGKKLRFENIPTLAAHPSNPFNGDDGSAETEELITTSIAPLYELAQAGLLNVAMTSAEAFNRLSRQVLGLDGEYAKDILRFEGNVRLSDLTASMGSIMLHDKSYKTVRIQQPDGKITEVVLPNPDTPAGFGIELLQFSDGSRATIGQLMQLNNLLDDKQENQAPVPVGEINAPTASVDSLFSWTLPAGLFSDPDGDKLKIAVSLADGSPLPAWLSFDVETGTLSGTPAAAHQGSLALRLTATDAGGLEAKAEFALNVMPINRAPTVAGAVNGQTATADTPFALPLLAGLFSDPDGDVLSHAVTLADGSPLPAWLSFDAVTGVLSGTPGNAQAGELALLVVATDTAGLRATVPFSLQVLAVNHAPAVAGKVDAQVLMVGKPYSLQLPQDLFTDADAEDSLNVTFKLADGGDLPAWLVYDAASRTLAGTPMGQPGSLQLLVIASDNHGAKVQMPLEMTIAANPYMQLGAGAADNLAGSAQDDSLFGLAGNDTLNGAAGADALVGGAGNDSLLGGAGKDTYLFGLGDGLDVVNEHYNASGDSFVFGSGIAQADIVLQRGSGAAVNDLVIKYSAQDAITLQSFFTNATWYEPLKLETLRFGDGSSVTLQDLLQKHGLMGSAVADDLSVASVVTTEGFALNGLAGNDTLTGSQGTDSLEGGLGNDSLVGGLGNDTLIGGVGNDTLKGDAGNNSYLFRLGDGLDVVAEQYNSAADSLNFGNGIAQADIVLRRGSGAAVNDLVVHYSAADAFTLPSFFTNTAWFDGLKGETLQFADGSSTSLKQMLAQAGLLGTADANDLSILSAATNDGMTLHGLGGNDTLTGSLGADTLVGGTGSDMLKGGGGSNSYVFNLGDGVDVISEQYNSVADTVIFGSGILPADVVLQRGTGANENDLVIKYSATDAVTLPGVFSNVTWFDGLKGQVFRFADGTSLTLKQALALAGLAGSAGADSISIVSAATTDGMTLNGLAGNDTLTGSLGADTLVGGAGNDSLVGGQGSNAYVFNLGDGHDVVNEHYASAADTLQFGPGTTLSGLSLRQGVSGGSPNNDLVIQYGANESVTLLSMLTNAPWYDGLKQQTLKFADGSSITLQSLMSQQGLMGSAGNDTMSVAGTGTQDGLRLNGLEGADTLTGGLGADILLGGAGNDSLSGGAGADVLAGGTGDDILIGAGGSDVYQVALGGGKDAIRENDAVAGNSDTLQFLDVASTAITSIQKVGQNLVFQYGNGDQVTIEGQYYSVDPTRFRVELFSFSDNVTWTDAQVQAKLTPVAGLSVNALLRPQEQVVHSGLDLDGVPPPSANLNQRLGQRANQEFGPLAAGLSLAMERNPEEQVRRNGLDLDGVPPPSANLNKRVGYTLSPYLSRPVAGLSVDMTLRPQEQVVRAGLDLDGVPPPSASLNNRTGHTADQQLNLLVDAMASFAPSAMGNLGAVAQDADMYRPVLAVSHH
ncbi:putative Ig domain-containing protein [Chitinimonas sp. JJ19]|uniref:putative Ig domain-containing protein n=1 Tax=Chitinimonas sp. JJ19 TaxID=3109352 RepID=UPI002FFF0A94